VRFLAWSSVTAPSTAVAGDEFLLTIGLSRDRHRSSAPIRVDLFDGETAFDLELDVAGSGLEAPRGWSHTLRVDLEGELPSISIPMRVRSDAPNGRALIHVAFLKDGIVCGNATSVMTIGLTEPAALPGEMGACVLPAVDEEPADLLVMIRKADGNSATGRYIWSMRSTRAAVDPRSFPIDLGDDARTFARALMRDVVESDDTALLEPVLRSIGKDIAAHVPPAFWGALHAVATALAPDQRPPSVLFYSAEEFVPWELALMEPGLDDGPPYLGAQAVIGRWLHSQSGVIPASPPSSIPVEDLAVLAPEYDEATYLPTLTAALREAKYMIDEYGAIAVDATDDDIRRLLDAKITRGDGSPAEIRLVHFAGHGSSDPTRPGDAGLYLVNGKRLSPRVFGASTLGSRFGPLLFINACEAGVAQRLLADNAGFAGMSLRGGFRGFIAPLWSVDDATAGAIAHRFYDDTLGSNALPVGNALRDIRRTFRSSSEHSTALSYVYYGHPRLRLRDEREAHG
jgi:hypothetical protein